MSRNWRVGFLLFVTGCALFVSVGIHWLRITPVAMVDFRAVYCGARCLIEHRDPYNPGDMERAYVIDAAGHSEDDASIRQAATVYIYLPTAFILTLPFAFMTWGPAHVVWIAVTIAVFILASFLIWSMGARQAPVLSGWLLLYFLLTSELIIEVGNAAGIAVSLCVIAVWCFLQERFVPAGIFFLAISLLVKPHDTAFVWLYFLLIDGQNRKRALWTGLLCVLLALPMFWWTSRIAPDWLQEMNSNLAQHITPGGDSDPGPNGYGAVAGAHGAPLISLQTTISVFRDDARFYNPVTYLVCGASLALWIIAVLRSHSTTANSWIALASVAPLSMLPVYHRQQDTRILLLTIPAFALVWAQRGLIRWLAAGISFAGVIFTGDASLQLLGFLAKRLGASTSTVSGKLLFVFVARPAPLVLFAMGLFYLWILWRGSPVCLPTADVTMTVSDDHEP